MYRIVTLVFTLLLFYDAQSQNTPPSTLKEYSKVFKTYGFADPDPVARPGAIYPYYRFDGYTDKPENKEWNVVELENEFIRIMVLPEIGGKIWGAWEKSSGRPFIYYNQVVKFRDVAMRGAWTSGGIEANYGIIGHTPNCATPVDYSTEKKADGSVSCYIGTLDLLTETYWTIEINLPKDKAYFTTNSFWHNSTPIEQPYYTWMNVGMKASGNLEFIYPGTRYLGHAGEYADWKINRENGKDISFYEQNNFGGPKSYHVFGKYAEFFGVYYHNEDFGMGRYSAHDEKPGKKIWIWGLSPQGMIWEKLLTDTDGQYVEVQSGRLFNQAAEQSSFTPFKNRGFAPGISDSWTEYWFPVKDTKGFVQANSYGALNVRYGNGYLKLGISPLQDLTDTLKVFNSDQLVYSKRLSLKTLKAFEDSIQFSGGADNLLVTLGGTKLRYNSNHGEGLLNRPVDSPKDFDWNSAYGLYLQGKENIRQRHYEQAEQKLKSCLVKDSNYLPALTEMSMLMYRGMSYQASLDYARHALSIDTYDPAANYYYGLANDKLGNISDARDGFDLATASVEYRGPAYLQLSKGYFRAGDFTKSIHYADKSLEVNSGNVEAYQVKALIYRLTNEKEKAIASLEKLHALNPLNHFVRFEEFRWQISEVNKNKFTGLIRNEMPKETYLHLADWYFSLGQPKESLEVLNLAPANPEAYYWMAFLKTELGSEGGLELIEKANALSPELVFPFRPASAEVLKWVTSRSPYWAPKYYLGLIYWSRGNTNTAKELFAQCGNPDFAPFYAVRAALLPENFASDLKKASRLDPHQWRYGKLSIDYFAEEKDYVEALAVAKDYHARFPDDFRLSMLLAKTLLLNKQYKASIDLLGQTTILPYEGSTDGRQLHREAWLMQAVQQMRSKNYKAALGSVATARNWPENLGVGKPYESDIDSRLENYMEGNCYEKTKRTDLAMKKWNEIISFKGKWNNANTLITALALRKTNRSTEAEELLAGWLQKEPENKLAQWCNDVFHGNKAVGDLEGDEVYRVLKELVADSSSR